MAGEQTTKRVTAADFIAMGLNLAVLRQLHNEPGGTMLYHDCPNCGPRVLMLACRVGLQRKVSCCSCSYTKTG